MNAETIAVGSELLTPLRTDTNSLLLTAKLNELGVAVHFKTIVGDRRADLVSAARTALSRADIVIFIGGLGPTEDDLTREAVAETVGRELRRDDSIIEKLRARFASRGYKMTENNLKQGDVIEGASVLENPRGSAPGQFLETDISGKKRVLVLLPGPPHELTHMFEQKVMARLREIVPPRHIAVRVLKLAMVPESQADKRAAPIYREHPEIETTILANAGGEIQFQLRAQALTIEDAQKKVDKLASLLEDEFEDAIFSTQDESLEQIVGYYGSSRYFLGGAVVYDNSLKTSLAGVPPIMIAEHGAVSREVAEALAEGIRKRCKATYGVGVTGIAGPGGGTDQKPVGLVFIALSDGERTDVLERKFPGDRERIRHWASQQALDMVRRKLI